MLASGGRFLEVKTDRYRRAGCAASQNNARTFVSRLDVGRARANLDAYEICSVGPVKNVKLRQVLGVGNTESRAPSRMLRIIVWSV